VQFEDSLTKRPVAKVCAAGFGETRDSAVISLKSQVPKPGGRAALESSLTLATAAYNRRRWFGRGHPRNKEL
jgi:hypothetical protein